MTSSVISRIARGGVSFITALLVAARCDAQVQNTAKTAPRFDIVSFKHVGTFSNGGQSRPLRFQAGRLTGKKVLISFLYFAYPQMPWKYAGPNWVKDEVYEIGGVAPTGTGENTARAMLRTALAERLGLSCHFEERESPVYALLAGNGQPKLAPAAQNARESGTEHMGMYKTESATLASFADFLSGQMDRAVVDMTGLRGRYRFSLDWNSELQAGGPEAARSEIFRIVKTLGLKLEPRKAPIKHLVVDRVERIPTPN